jgi:DNA-binding GntR family transcriptional regulator
MGAVRTAIDDGVLRPGIKYSVYQLAEALGISRTPVREALLQMEEAGLIHFEARQGFRILLPDPREIADIFAVRLALELPAAARAARGRDDDLSARLSQRMAAMRAAADGGDERAFAHYDQLLHDHILEASGNMRARSIIATLRETTRLLGANTANRTRTLTDIDAEHLPIVEAIVAGDALRARAAMRNHLISTGKTLVAQAVHDQELQADAEAIWLDAINDGIEN